MTEPILASPPQPPKLNDKRAAAAVSYAAERASDWERVAAFLKDQPEIATRASMSGNVVLRPANTIADPAAFMADAAKACVDAGGRAEQYQSGQYGGVNLCFGQIRIQVYADIDKVFSRRVTGVVEQVEYTLRFDLPQAGDADA